MKNNSLKTACWLTVIAIVAVSSVQAQSTPNQKLKPKSGINPTVRAAAAATSPFSKLKQPKLDSPKLGPIKPAQKLDSVEVALQSEAKFEFFESPLSDVVKKLGESYGIVVSVDKVAIEDAGYDEFLPITGKGNGRSLRFALRSLFQEYDFMAIARDGELLITTPEAFTNNPEKYVISRMYDVTDLVEPDAKKLLVVIRRHISPQSWLESNGGPATLDTIELKKKTILLVSHHSEGQYRIAEFLKQLRAVAAE